MCFVASAWVYVRTTYREGKDCHCTHLVYAGKRKIIIIIIINIQGQLPPWVNLPCSAALPFGAFEVVLQQPQNASAAAAVQELDAEQHPSPDQLQAVRAALQDLQPNAQLQDEVKAAFQQSGKHSKSCYSAGGVG